VIVACCCGAKLHHREDVVAQIDAMIGDHPCEHQLDDALVDVVTAEERVARGAEHRVRLVLELHHGEVERAAAEVEHGDDLVELPVRAVGECGRGRLVQDARDLEARDRGGTRRRRALCIVEARGHRDHGAVDRPAQPCRRDRAQVIEDHRRELDRRELTGTRAHRGHVVALDGLVDLVGHARADLPHGDAVGGLAHQSLERIDRVARVADPALLRFRTDEDGRVVGERDDRRLDRDARLVREHVHLPTAVFPRDDGVRRAQIDTDGTHQRPPYSVRSASR
jgi:hypothetical protein